MCELPHLEDESLEFRSSVSLLCLISVQWVHQPFDQLRGKDSCVSLVEVLEVTQSIQTPRTQCVDETTQVVEPGNVIEVQFQSVRSWIKNWQVPLWKVTDKNIPGQQSGILILDRENSFSKLQDELVVITLDRVEGQRHWKVWEFKHLYRLRRSSQSWERRSGQQREVKSISFFSLCYDSVFVIFIISLWSETMIFGSRVFLWKLNVWWSPKLGRLMPSLLFSLFSVMELFLLAWISCMVGRRGTSTIAFILEDTEILQPSRLSSLYCIQTCG